MLIDDGELFLEADEMDFSAVMLAPCGHAAANPACGLLGRR
jgi:hypothetical protein